MPDKSTQQERADLLQRLQHFLLDGGGAPQAIILRVGDQEAEAASIMRMTEGDESFIVLSDEPFQLAQSQPHECRITLDCNEVDPAKTLDKLTACGWKREALVATPAERLPEIGITATYVHEVQWRCTLVRYCNSKAEAMCDYQDYIESVLNRLWGRGTIGGWRVEYLPQSIQTHTQLSQGELDVNH